MTATDHFPHAEGADSAGQVPAAVRHPPWLFGAAGAVALGVLILAVLGATIDRGHQFAFDRAIMRRCAIRPIRWCRRVPAGSSNSCST